MTSLDRLIPLSVKSLYFPTSTSTYPSLYDSLQFLVQRRARMDRDVVKLRISLPRWPQLCSDGSQGPTMKEKAK